MREITRTLAGLAVAGLASLGAVPCVLAVPITPLVSNSSAAAVTAGFVPVDISDFAVDVQPAAAAAAKTVTNAPAGAETADGAAAATVDTTDINASVVRSRSQVSTAASPPAPDPTPAMTDGSIAAFNATLSAAGLAPAGTATVDLRLAVRGSLIYADPGGGAITVIDPDFDLPVSGISTNVSVILAIAAATTPVPIPPPLLPLFNGSATLRSPMVAGNAPDLVLEGDWASRPGDFTAVTCDALMVCRVDVAMTLLLAGVESLGFGETFDIGLILETNADAISDTGRMAASLFFDSASVGVSLTAQVPEPGTLALVALAMLVIAAMRGAGARRHAEL